MGAPASICAHYYIHTSILQFKYNIGNMVLHEWLHPMYRVLICIYLIYIYMYQNIYMYIYIHIKISSISWAQNDQHPWMSKRCSYLYLNLISNHWLYIDHQRWFHLWWSFWCHFDIIHWPQIDVHLMSMCPLGKDATENKGFMTIDNLQKLSVKFN